MSYIVGKMRDSVQDRRTTIGLPTKSRGEVRPWARGHEISWDSQSLWDSEARCLHSGLCSIDEGVFALLPERTGVADLFLFRRQLLF
jgi:hypothetical protein